jgi:hypothetical protein
MEPDRDRALRADLRQFSRVVPRWATAASMPGCARPVGASTARPSSGCGARKAYGCRSGGASASGSRVWTAPADRLAAEHPDHVWALDYQFDQTTDGRILKLLNVVDEHTREALTITVDRRIVAAATVKVLDRLVAERQTALRFIRCDNGPELTPTPCATGAASPVPGPATSSPARPGRTRTWRASAAGCVMSCLLLRPSAACSRPGCWSRTGDRVQHRPTPQRPGLPDPAQYA